MAAGTNPSQPRYCDVEIREVDMDVITPIAGLRQGADPSHGVVTLLPLVYLTNIRRLTFVGKNAVVIIVPKVVNQVEVLDLNICPWHVTPPN